MMQIGIAPMLLISALLAVGVFDIPVVYASPVCAILMCLAAYFVSRERKALRLAEGLFVLATCKPLITAFSGHGGNDVSHWLQSVAATLSSDAVVITASAIVFVLALIFGIFGPLRHMKSVEDLLKEHERR